jgi:hypothetical protein
VPPAPSPALINPTGGPIAPMGRPGIGDAPGGFGNPAGGQIGLNPGLALANAQILVHDATLQEGKTYRYAVRYKLYNPMFDKPALAIPDVAAKFDIDSPDPSDPKGFPKPTPPELPIDPEKLWTEPVTVESLSRIFVQDIQLTNTRVELVVYTWKDGRWNERMVKQKMPGDPIMAGKDGKDPTPWTVVDVRKDLHSSPPEPYVLLMDNTGALMRRTVAEDQASPDLAKLKAQAAGGAAAAAAR